MSGAATYDVIVIGAGIVGASAALAAVAKGAKVALVDAGFAGQASTAGAGIVSPVALDRGEDRPEWTSVITRCVDHYQELLSTVDALDPAGMGSGTFREVGELIVARSDPDECATLAAIKGRLSTETGRRAHGVSVSPTDVEGSDVRKYWPELREDLVGLFIADVGRVVGSRLTARLITSASRLGHEQGHGPRLTVVPGLAIVGSGTARDVSVGQDRLSAGAVVLATGAWAAPGSEVFGLAVRVRPVRGQIVHIRLPNVPTGERPVVNTIGAGYALGFDDRVVIGATHEDVGFDARVTAGGQHAVLDAALELAPGLAGASFVETRVGLRPVSSDGLPLVGAVAPGIHIVTGLGAWGLTLGPLLGQLGAEEALGHPLPDWLQFLSPTRTPAVVAQDESVPIRTGAA